MPRTTSPTSPQERAALPQAAAIAPLPPLELRELPRAMLSAIVAAGAELAELERLLAKSGDNVVGLLLERERNFYEWTHYPAGDVYDRETGAQFYYHAHPKAERPGEHGHFHAFLRARGMPKGTRAALLSRTRPAAAADDALCHLVAVAMSEKGQPIELFTTNRWVTDETWYAARDVIAMLERFKVELLRPSWPVNRWITALLRIFRPQIEALVLERDRVMGEWQRRHPGLDVLEDRRLPVLSRIPISPEAQTAAALAALKRRPRA